MLINYDRLIVKMSEDDETTSRSLVVELCRLFYNHGIFNIAIFFIIFLKLSLILFKDGSLELEEVLVSNLVTEYT